MRQRSLRAGDHSCAIRAGNGGVVCWGNHDQGQVTPPDIVNGASGSASAISAGGAHSCAISAGTGAVVCWGINNWGQAIPPPSVDGTTGSAVAIAAGGRHTLALPEPDAALLLASGVAGVVALGRRRIRNYR